ncbi:aldo/keto reductase [Flavobacterium sp. S87F.05.LMB.W.Kidney.N]|uniref:aldo/keto reductase n=1 Tax=Flavobacterium sp. S87F.05.LMB.W.Kidney.N TaxID=1278758 RepID=UPI0010660520|nr:aldo/keto reductase [Flavobacterium sp. S87F.05.LMB.W.Kidney.N]TDX11247.1 aryl-alcohol dehydrogenase-like predicted oxidoreductase [Flavobacterium sp. S87F.05.LMB.W.Kidney.N]
MKYKVLGNTGLFVSEMCLGTMTFGQSGGKYAAASGVLQDEANAIIKKAFDSGVNFIDTANVYARGESEQIVGEAIKKLGISRHEIVLSTKAGHSTGGGPNDGGNSRYHLINQVEQSLKRLGTDHVDVFHLHGWDPATPLEETMRALDDLVKRGLVRYLGVSNWTAWQIEKTLGISANLGKERFECVQSYYSLAGRDIEREILPMLAYENLGLMVFSPLAGGYLSGKYSNGESGRRTTIQFPPVDESRSRETLSVLEEISKIHNTTPASVALAWLLQNKHVTSVILGIKKIEQLEDNLGASKISLSTKEIISLNESSELPVEYPGWMAGTTAHRQELLHSGTLQ